MGAVTEMGSTVAPACNCKRRVRKVNEHLSAGVEQRDGCLGFKGILDGLERLSILVRENLQTAQSIYTFVELV
jgi:hypothetical protein